MNPEDDNPDLDARRSAWADALNNLGSTKDFDRPSSDQPGTGEPVEIASYVIVKRIGMGGMGIVYEVELTPGFELPGYEGKPLALKLIRPDLKDDSSVQRHFTIESRAQTKMDHPRILPVLDSGNSPYGPWFVTPFMKTGSLAELLSSGRELEDSQIEETALQIAEAINRSHELGFLHRDLKPSNILLDEDGNAVLTDFGLSRHLAHDSLVSRETDAQLGTPAYMSPLVAAGKPDFGCDIYAFGAILHELLSGSPPYAGRTAEEVLRQIHDGPPAPLRQLCPNRPAWLMRLADACMERDPGKRVASPATIVTALESRSFGRSPKLVLSFGALCLIGFFIFLFTGPLGKPRTSQPSPENHGTRATISPTNELRMVETYDLNAPELPAQARVESWEGNISHEQGRILARELDGRAALSFPAQANDDLHSIELQWEAMLDANSHRGNSSGIALLNHAGREIRFQDRAAKNDHGDQTVTLISDGAGNNRTNLVRNERKAVSSRLRYRFILNPDGFIATARVSETDETVFTFTNATEHFAPRDLAHVRFEINATDSTVWLDNLKIIRTCRTNSPVAKNPNLSRIAINTNSWQLVIPPGKQAHWKMMSMGLRQWADTPRGGTTLLTKRTFDARRTTLYLKWRARGRGEFHSVLCGWGKSTGDPVDLPHFLASSGNTYNGSFLIQDDTWYFTRLHVDESGNYEAYTATTSYDDQGGSTVAVQRGQVAPQLLKQAHIMLASGDAHADDTWSEIGEAIVRPGPESNAN